MSAGTVFSGLSFLLSGVQFFQARKNARQQEKYYDALARDKRLEGRIKAVESKEKSNEILRRTKIALASNIAGGYASGVIPYVGSVDTINKQQILRPASIDYGILGMESVLAIEKANREARNLEYQGDIAKRQGYAQALGGLAMAGLQFGMSGALDFGSGFVGGQSNISNIGAASQINTAGTSSVMSSVARPGQASFTRSIAGGANPISGNYGSFNTAGGPSFMGI
tara:strand:+ start:1708 stop:2385 length:678 start_codon:yes stop_codon:yes gene_type:complete